MSNRRLYWQRFYGKYLFESVADAIDDTVRTIGEGKMTSKEIGRSISDLNDMADHGILAKEGKGRDAVFTASQRPYDGGDPLESWGEPYVSIRDMLRDAGPLTPGEIRETFGESGLKAVQAMCDYHAFVVRDKDRRYGYMEEAR